MIEKNVLRSFATLLAFALIPTLVMAGASLVAGDYRPAAPTAAASATDIGPTLSASQAIAVVTSHLSPDADCKRLLQSQDAWQAVYQGNGVWLVSQAPVPLSTREPGAWRVFEADKSYDALHPFVC